MGEKKVSAIEFHCTTNPEVVIRFWLDTDGELVIIRNPGSDRSPMATETLSSHDRLKLLEFLQSGGA